MQSTENLQQIVTSLNVLQASQSLRKTVFALAVCTSGLSHGRYGRLSPTTKVIQDKTYYLFSPSMVYCFLKFSITIYRLNSFLQEELLLMDLGSEVTTIYMLSKMLVWSDFSLPDISDLTDGLPFES